MKIVIQKFGGQSLTTTELRQHAAGQVKRALDQGLTPIVVVSALGRRGSPYATDTLLDLVSSVRERPSGRSLDMAASCGEVLAAVVFAEHLAAEGLAAVPMTGWQAGIQTNALFGSARIQSIDTRRLLNELQAGKTPIVTGFQGVTADGEITTIGRGGSDTTAAALGSALDAEWVEIFTDVDGVKTADPSIVPEAGTIAALSYQEIVELAHLGAKVIHPRAVEIAMEKGIPLKVQSLFAVGGGTIIGGRGRLPQPGSAPIRERVVAGIAHIPGRAKVQICADVDLNASGLALKVFQRLAQNGISVDLIYLSPDRMGFIIDGERAAAAESILAALNIRCDVAAGYAKVSVVGAGMHGVPGVMARIVSCLERISVPILQTTDSHANISCLIAEHHLAAAVSALHDEFDLGKSPHRDREE